MEKRGKVSGYFRTGPNQWLRTTRKCCWRMEGVIMRLLQYRDLRRRSHVARRKQLALTFRDFERHKRDTSRHDPPIPTHGHASLHLFLNSITISLSTQHKFSISTGESFQRFESYEVSRNVFDARHEGSHQSCRRHRTGITARIISPLPSCRACRKGFIVWWRAIDPMVMLFICPGNSLTKL